eukprot:1136653-Pelagomonas_calceolata.AAC.3
MAACVHTSSNTSITTMRLHRFAALTEQILFRPELQEATHTLWLSPWLQCLSPVHLVRLLWAFGSHAHAVCWRQPEITQALANAVSDEGSGGLKPCRHCEACVNVLAAT